MSTRFFVETPIRSQRVVLRGPEAHHLAKVMRCKAGASVALFDGSGAEFPARVLEVRSKEVLLEVAAKEEFDRELPGTLVLATALPKSERSRWLVEKAVELGVTRLVPLVTRRSVVVAGRGRLERLRRTVVEASKQCGRNRLMQIAPSESWSEFLYGAEGLRWLADPNAPQLARQPEPGVIEGVGAGGRLVTIAVGPEGGFCPDEVQQAIEAGWQLVRIGRRTLRTETAAVALCALGAHWLESAAPGQDKPAAPKPGKRGA